VNEGLRSWFLRLLAVGIAVGLWFGVSMEDREVLSEKLVVASVSYNRPERFVILDPTPTVEVRVRGSSRSIRRLNPFMVDVQVKLPAEVGTATIPLGPENVLMPEELELVSIQPNEIRVQLDREVTLRIPVVPQISGTAARGAEVGEAEVFPGQVQVTGPQSVLERIQSLTTRPVDIEGRSTTVEEVVNVIAPDPLVQIVQPSKVSVRVAIEPPEGDDDRRARKESP
jgi:YbbR domain-containing protein